MSFVLPFVSTFSVTGYVISLPWSALKTGPRPGKRSHAVLSVIFGIFGKFGIGIGTRFFLVDYFFVEKNLKIVGRKKFWDQKFSIFPDKNFDEKVNENSKF